MAKKSRMEIEEFFPLYRKAMEEGMTRDDFAEMIRVEVDTVYQRVYELMTENPELVEQGLRQLPRKTSLPMKQRVLAAWGGAEPAKAADPKPKAKAKAEPQPKVETPEAATVVVAPVPNPEIMDELSKLLGN